MQATGLVWRYEVSAQVFEEAAVDLSRALAAYEQGRAGKAKARKVGFPRRKRKGRCRESFRLRNKAGSGGACSIRVGDGHPRSVTLPRFGMVRVHDDTRRLRRLLRPDSRDDPETGRSVVAPRARILFATCRRHGARWYISLNIDAPDFHLSAVTHPALATSMVGLSGWTVAFPLSPWRPPPPEQRLAASRHPGRSGAACGA